MRIRQIGLVLVLVLAVACGGGKKSEDTMKAGGGKSLYDRLGGQDAITAVVDDFVNNATVNATIKDRFTNTNAANLKAKLVEQICQETGGPCKYTGKDMRTAHTGMKLSEEEFGALVDEIVKSLDKFKVGEPEKKELLDALGGMKGDVVGI